MGKVPRPLEPLVNALGSLPMESYVLALKSAALHMQVSGGTVPLVAVSREQDLSLGRRLGTDAHLRRWQGRDEDIDPAELSGNLGSCDLGESSLAQVCALAFHPLPPLPNPRWWPPG